MLEKIFLSIDYVTLTKSHNSCTLLLRPYWNDDAFDVILHLYSLCSFYELHWKIQVNLWLKLILILIKSHLTPSVQYLIYQMSAKLKLHSLYIFYWCCCSTFCFLKQPNYSLSRVLVSIALILYFQYL